MQKAGFSEIPGPVRGPCAVFLPNAGRDCEAATERPGETDCGPAQTDLSADFCDELIELKNDFGEIITNCQCLSGLLSLILEKKLALLYPQIDGAVPQLTCYCCVR